MDSGICLTQKFLSNQWKNHSLAHDPLYCIVINWLYWSFVVSPADYQQGESVRIMYVHVPAAWMSLFIYIVMAIASGIGLIWQIKTRSYSGKSIRTYWCCFYFVGISDG
ncbi:Cytochrome c-type biogenesis protein CcmC, putative heme lyase for CcmE [uncultured Gammaproteobacteria bacterium]|nr:Cytochrome c-type biogenesis protein CcmC, putative heme lyase for CcmE [uncultured Gammaproteobacteria bacterium]